MHRYVFGMTLIWAAVLPALSVHGLVLTDRGVDDGGRCLALILTPLMLTCLLQRSWWRRIMLIVQLVVVSLLTIVQVGVVIATRRRAMTASHYSAFLVTVGASASASAARSHYEHLLQDLIYVASSLFVLAISMALTSAQGYAADQLAGMSTLIVFSLVHHVYAAAVYVAYIGLISAVDENVV